MDSKYARNFLKIYKIGHKIIMITKKFRIIIKKMMPSRLIIQRLPNSKCKYIVLTFDDGPSEENTIKVLRILDKYSIKAMFFVVGKRIEKSPHILKLINDGGHIVCNHSYFHDSQIASSPLKSYMDIKKCNDLILKHCNKKSQFYRPPCGAIKISNYLSARLLRQKILFWSLEAKDWDCKTISDANKVVDTIVENIKPSDVILLHDDHSYIEFILDKLLPILVKMKYEFKLVS